MPRDGYAYDVPRAIARCVDTAGCGEQACFYVVKLTDFAMQNPYLLLRRAASRGQRKIDWSHVWILHSFAVWVPDGPARCHPAWMEDPILARVVEALRPLPGLAALVLGGS